MVCGGCGKRRIVHSQKKEDFNIVGKYGNLPDRQIKARLEVHKRRYCKQCEKRYDCDFKMYLDCRKGS